MTASRAFVLGGGIAGIAAALRLRARGHDVTMLEAHRWLGGRAFSVPDDKLGGVRDNGPHVMLGCYDEFRKLLRELDSERLFVRAPALTVTYADARGARAELRLSRWPVPLAMPFALLRLSALTLGERLRALWGFAGVLLGAARLATLEDWLRRYRQHGGPRRFLWDPLCLAVMNAPASRVSARLFLATMRRAFLGSAARGAIWIPDAPWSEIVGEPALRLLRARGVSVVFEARVRTLRVEGNHVCAIEGDGFVPISVDARDLVVSTLPWHRLAACLPAGDPVASVAAQFAGRPIASVYFALDHDADLPDAPLVALVDGEPFHFLARRPRDGKRRFALVAGGTDAIAGMTAEQLAIAACAQLARHFPTVQVDVAKARVVKETHATLLADPKAQAFRPALGPHPRIHNLRLAGDWCATGLPSTMEAAAVSAARL